MENALLSCCHSTGHVFASVASVSVRFIVRLTFESLQRVNCVFLRCRNNFVDCFSGRWKNDVPNLWCWPSLPWNIASTQKSPTLKSRASYRSCVVLVCYLVSTTTYIRPGDYRKEPFKFFVHDIGLGLEDRATLVFTRATAGCEEAFHGYGKSFEQRLTEKDRKAPSDTGRFSIITKVSDMS